MDRKERIEEEFELAEEVEAVQQYEALTDDFLHITTSLIADEVAQRLSAVKGAAVDLGTGPGNLVVEIAIRFPHLLVIGLDISLSMAQRARQRSSKAGLDNTAFVVADVHMLPFKSESVGMIVSQGSIHHWRSLNIALAEIRQVLMTSGFIYMSDLRRDAPYELVTMIATLLNKKQARAFLNSVQAAYTIDELDALVKHVGIDHARVEPEKFSRETLVKHRDELRRSPMRGMRQGSVNIRIVSECRSESEGKGEVL